MKNKRWRGVFMYWDMGSDGKTDRQTDGQTEIRIII